MLAATYAIAYAAPQTLIIWGLVWAFMLRRKGIRARPAHAATHLLLLLAVVVGLNAVAAANRDIDFPVHLVILILSIASCSRLRAGARKDAP